MAVEHTFSMIKPDAVAGNMIGQIYSRLEAAGFQIIAAKMVHLTKEEAEGFYAIHKAQHFFASLIEFMISGPIMVQVLEREEAVTEYRKLMGTTDPKRALPGTLRYEFAQSISRNAVHGSDSRETAATEVAYFFGDHAVAPVQICPRNN